MDNGETIFYVLVIIISAAISIWTINEMIQGSPAKQAQRKNKRLAEIARRHELARQQKANH